MMDRRKSIYRVTLWGGAVNVLLLAFKFVAGPEKCLPAHGVAERRYRADGLYAACLFRVRGGVAPARLPPREGG